MEAEYNRLKMLSAALTQFVENAKDEEAMSRAEREEHELAQDELELVNERLEAALI
jgi:hypothetical protein